MPAYDPPSRPSAPTAREGRGTDGLDRRALLALAAGGGPALCRPIPGCRPDRVRLRGWPIARHPELARTVPADRTGPRSPLARVGPDGSATRAMPPLAIRRVAVAPDRRRAFVSSLEGESFL